MKNLFLLLFVLASSLMFGQTFQVNTFVAVNAGQCIALDAGRYKPCNNFRAVAPAVPIGVSLNSVPASLPHTPPHVITVQYAGIVTVPDTSFGGFINPGDYLGDVDGTGNLNDLSVPQTGLPKAIFGPTFAGIAVTETGTSILMIVQPGYWTN